MTIQAEPFRWIDAQFERMRGLVIDWANTNSGSHHLAGLERMAQKLAMAFGELGEIQVQDLPPQEMVDSEGQVTHIPLGKAISLSKRPEAPIRVLLGIHMDTVYPADHPFQSIADIDLNRLRGPGVADAKGGLAIMLVALEAFERSPLAKNLGWEVLINPDEELGSPGSVKLFEAAAKRNHVGLLYEPALPTGALVSGRKGSGNFTVVVKGRSAHAGRDFHLGRNAIHALADLIVAIKEMGRKIPSLTVNVGRIEGGGPVNVVPDLAIGRFNLRVTSREDQLAAESELAKIVAETMRQDGISATLYGGFSAPPKNIDEPMQRLMRGIERCGRDLGIDIRWESSGGVCDGNRLAAAGLPNVDSLGVRGGGIHTDNEYVLLDSLTERAKLSALILMKLAAGEIVLGL
jgi:glutamate carboxypeptidase